MENRIIGYSELKRIVDAWREPFDRVGINLYVVISGGRAKAEVEWNEKLADTQAFHIAQRAVKEFKYNGWEVDFYA